MATGRIQKQIDRLLDEAEEASADRKWEIVRDRAQHALTFDPENANATAFLAAAERALGDHEPAKTTASSAATQSPSFSATQRDEPKSFADGRYQIKRFLGLGVPSDARATHRT